VAAQCCSFLRYSPTNLERWDPYVEWLKTLRADDTVVTFNYDRVVETASSAEAGGRGVLPLTFEHRSDIRDVIDRARSAQISILAKLHGSVDWEHDDTPGRTMPVRTSPNREYAVTNSSQPLYICTPGGSKKARAQKELKPLWDFAHERLAEADHVIFLGYRFPPSDAQARTSILGAIRRSTEARLCRVTIVLGADAGGAQRLELLLRHAARGPSSVHIENTSLGVEDYLSLFRG